MASTEHNATDDSSLWFSMGSRNNNDRPRLLKSSLKWRFLLRSVGLPMFVFLSMYFGSVYHFFRFYQQSSAPIHQQLSLLDTSQRAVPVSRPRIVAFVFPQFHRDDINDRLWGDNFTDWDSLRAAPNYNRLGHLIPRPTELGYYDYTKLAPRRQQAELVRTYGLDGLIFHHYWFYDHPGPNLHAPLEAMLQDGEPNVPFALHWCASKWTTTWNSAVRDTFKMKEPGVLQKQYFPNETNDPLIVKHYQWLRRFFHHKNYIKVNGKPLFMLYQRKPGSFVVLQKMQELARNDGFPGLFLTVGLTKPHPHLMPIGNVHQYESKPQEINGKTIENFDRVLAYPNPTEWNVNRTMKVPNDCGRLSRVMEMPGIISSFDNTPRRPFAEANVWSSAAADVTIERFRTSLEAAYHYESCCVVLSNDNTMEERLIVINAMNEWAEGMALEPSNVYGRRFLESIRTVKEDQQRNPDCRPPPPS